MACKVDPLEDNKYQGVVLMLFSFITFIILGNIVCFHLHHLILLTGNNLKDENIKVYMNGSPRIFVLKSETV